MLPPQFQIIRKSYTSKQHVLSGFDLGPCAVLFDGNDVWALESFTRSVATGVIGVERCHRSMHFEDRLVKYAGRGFALHVPDLDFSRISRNLAEQGKNISLSCLIKLFLF